MRGLASYLAKAVAVALDAIATATFVLIVALMIFLVLARYLFGLSIVGLHELILLFAIQLYMAGALVAARRREQLTVDWLPQQLSGSTRAINEAAIAVVTIVVTVFFIYWSYRMFTWGLQRPQTTPALAIPLWLPQAALMVAAVGSFLYALRDLARALRRARARRNGTAD